MRLKSTIWNSISGLANKVVSIIFAFLVRWFFVRNLSVELLGLEGLFANILGVFALVDAGFGTAVAYSLYKPLFEGNRQLVSSIMELFRKAYVLIGVVIMAISIMFSVFIPYFVKDVSVEHNDIRMLFLVYAANVSLSYFFSYKRTFLYACQKNYAVLNVDTIIKIVQSTFQIIILIRCKNYLMYLFTFPIFGLIGNAVISIFADRENQYDKRTMVGLPTEYRCRLKSRIRTVAITNLSWTGITSTDNIIISSFVGVVALAKNSNYAVIFSSLNSLLGLFLGGAAASVGNLIAEGDKNKLKEYFDRYNYMFHIVSLYVSLGLFFFSEDVILIWVGKNYIFGRFSVFLISFNLLLSLIYKPLADYMNGAGLFEYYKKYSVYALILNLSVSIILSLFIGINGVFIGTCLTYIFLVICVVKILYKYLFQDDSSEYLNNFIKLIIPALIFFLAYWAICRFLTGGSYGNLLVRLLIFTSLYAVILCVSQKNDRKFKFLINLISGILINLKNKIHKDIGGV